MLLSRVADALYWISRYLERAEHAIRLIDVRLDLGLDRRPDGWEFGGLYTSLGLLPENHRARYPGALIDAVVFDPSNRGSVAACVTAARENAQQVREEISADMWQQINELYLLITAESRNLAPADLPGFCQQVRMGCHLIHGILHVTMSHNHAWQFIRLGSQLERADKTTRILDVKYFILLPSLSDVGTPYDDVQWSAVLKSVSGFEMYRKRHGRISPEKIAEFLLLDAEFPRALRYCIAIADRSLHLITGTPVGTYSCPSEQRMGMLRGELDFANVEQILSTGLHEFCDAAQTKMNTIDECISGDFFAQRPLTSIARA